jgi:alpha-glucosidase
MEAVRKAARYKMVVDIHDSYRPTGFSRTFPNLLTQEGIRGNEHMPTSRHNCTLPFTRFVAGAGDYTVCYYTNRIKTTHAHQLAIAAAFYSPLQFLFWYDEPKAFEGEPEIEFFRHVPTVWDETRVLQGEIGEHVTIARRRGREWYIGSLTNEQPREMELSLAFLDPQRKYTANIYGDDDTVASKTKVGIRRVAVNHKSMLPARLLANGGQAVRIVPEP